MIQYKCNIIYGVSGESNIINLWRTNFCNILNANSIDGDLKSEIMGKLENVQYTEDMTISSVDVSHLIGQLKCGKVAASDDARCLYMYVIVRMLYICQGWGQVQYLYLVLVLKYIFIST